MAKRAEEKERRRLERIEAEAAAEKAASRKRTTQIAVGAVLALALIAAVVLVATAGGGSGSGSKVSATKVAADAKAAGCTYTISKSEGRSHTAKKVSYKTNPPTSGSHNPVAAQDGIYAAGNAPAKEAFVHALEHGRVEFQYKPGTPAAQVAQMRKLAESAFNGTDGYHTLLFENNTKMPSPFAATAWTHSIACDSLSPKAVTAMTSFRDAFTDKGPEFIP